MKSRRDERGPGRRHVAVAGGDGRSVNNLPPRLRAGVRSYRSSRCGGRGELCRLRTAIRAGTVRLLIIKIRFIGHSECYALKALCKRCGVCFKIARGSSIKPYLSTGEE